MSAQIDHGARLAKSGVRKSGNVSRNASFLAVHHVLKVEEHQREGR
jgi:hypothetical protein